MAGKAVAVLLCVLWAGSLALGKTQKVTLKDGRTFTGEVTKTEGGYRIQMAVGTFECRADEVLSISDVATPMDEYRQRLQKIDPNSAEDHYTLGEWAFKNDLAGVAVQELRAALKIDPKHLKASALLQQAEAKLREPPTTGPVRPTGDPNRPVAGIKPEWLVPEEDILRVRMEELRENERLPVRFRNDVINRFIKAMQGREEFKQQGFEDHFKGWTPARKVHFIRMKFPDRNPYKDDILVQRDPQFMIDFRNRIWPLVEQYCAKPECHGAGKPKGGMRLFTVAGRNERVNYTNYVILDGCVRKGRRVVDRSNPDQSLLLHFMLPEDLAQHKHPVKIQRAFPSRESRVYKFVLGWVESLRKPPHPDYRLKYKPPFGMKIVGRQSALLPDPDTKPSTQPGK
ncbi:MAG TPA: hypothetical protein VNA25_27880 [Phycisphaerae bacterium]|nr:hypothetical protein [Phycisphaerae bacterium]